MPGDLELSVVIPTRNKASRLRHTLAALAAQAGAFTWELIVVDDGSSDDTRQTVAATGSRLPVRLVPGDGRGRAAARNRGGEVASGKVLLFIDDDVLIGPDFLVRHHRAQAGGGALAHVPVLELPAAVRARDLASIVAALEHGPARPRLVMSSLERLVLLMADGQAPLVAPWLASAGANVSVPRLRWRAMGGFDEGFGVLWGCEDLEFGFRWWEAGHVLAVLREVRVVHLSHRRPHGWDEQARNLARFSQLHPRPEVEALGELLSAWGSPQRYLRAVADQVRSATAMPTSRPMS